MAGPRRNYTKWFKQRYGETPGGQKLAPRMWGSRWKTLKGGEAEFGYKQNLAAAQAAAEAAAQTATSQAGEVAEAESRVSRVRVYHDAAQTIGTGTWTALTFNSERWDNDGMHASAHATRLTAVFGGPYVIAGHVSWAANATGVRGLAIRLNGATYLGITFAASTGAAFATDVSICTVYNLAVDDYVELMVFQNSGGDLDVAASGNYSPEFGAVRY